MLIFIFNSQKTNKMKDEGYVIRNEFAAHFLTFQVMDWVDIFTREHYKNIIIKTLEYCRTQFGLKVFGYVIMPNHMHAIFQSPDGNLSKIITSFKKYTGREIILAIQTVPESRASWMLKRFEFALPESNTNSAHKFWRTDNHAKEIYSQKFLLEKLNYIHNNPVRAGWVYEQEDFVYSSARNYNKLIAVVDIDVLDI